ncbi:MAG: LysR family transcriptional regulator [Xanthomonadales bacterium]|nr:LysR family transcriptional regulator [Xanthomonadales bacterium]
MNAADLPPVAWLRAFDAAGRHGSFRAAAEFLNVTPSTISHQIADLERHLGVQLFERSARAVRLTQTGAELLADVAAAFSRLREATGRIRQRGQPVGVRISANPFLTAEVLVPLIAAFDQQFPDQRIQISATEVMEDPRDGRVDFCIRFGEGDWPGLERLPLYPVCAIPVSAPDLADLPARIDYPFRGQSAWQAWVARGGPVLPSSSVVRWFSDFAAAIRAAVQGVGITLAVWPVVQPLLRAGRLRRVDAAEVPLGQLYLLSRPLTPQQHQLRSVRDWLTQVLRDAAGVPSGPD